MTTIKKAVPKVIPIAAAKKVATAKKAVAAKANTLVKAPPISKADAAKKAFVEWLKVKDPALYEMALRRLAKKQKLNGFLDIFKSVVDVVKDVGPKVVDMKNQSKILDAQIKAAQAGNPPLAIPYTPIVANPNSPQGQAIINAGANYGLSTTTTGGFNRNWLLLGIPALILVWVLIRRKRR